MWARGMWLGLRALMCVLRGFTSKGDAQGSHWVQAEVIEHLDHLALMGFSSHEAVAQLEKAIAVTNQRQEVATDGV